jgi:hypothetical protein
VKKCFFEVNCVALPVWRGDIKKKFNSVKIKTKSLKIENKKREDREGDY